MSTGVLQLAQALNETATVGVAPVLLAARSASNTLRWYGALAMFRSNAKSSVG